MLDAQVEYFNVLIAYINAVFDARDAGFRLMHATGLLMPTAGAEGDWVAMFFSKNPERARLESSLKDTANIANSPADQNIAEKLGLSADSPQPNEASGVSLTPAPALGVGENKPRKGRVPGSEEEKTTRPTLKPAPILDPRFYR